MNDLILESAAFMRGRQARSRARITRILEAVQSIVLAEGVDGVTTTAVARAAEVPVGSVYQYFKDRDDLLDSLRAVIHAEVMAGVAMQAATMNVQAGWRAATAGLLKAFWVAAHERPVLAILNRWAMSSMPASRIASSKGSPEIQILDRFLADAGVKIPKERAPYVRQTIINLIQSLTDHAFAEMDEAAGDRLHDELTEVVIAYLAGFIPD